MRAGLVPKVWPLLAEAVEAGVQRGWNRAHKHTDAPHEVEVRAEIEKAVTNEICERFHVVEPQEEG